MPIERREDAWASGTRVDRSGRAIWGLASTPVDSTVSHIDSAASDAGSVVDATAEPQMQSIRRRKIKRESGVRKVAGYMAESKRGLRSSQVLAA
jgi:hypothetical protein